MSGTPLSVFAFRPGTASGARPGTSSGRRHLDNVSKSSQESSDKTIQREIASDNLLRILNYDKTFDANQIMVCAEKGKVKQFMAFVSRNSSLVASQDSTGFTPLHHACRTGQIGIIEELLKYNSSAACLVNRENEQGETPLHLAAYAGRVQSVQMLLREENIDVNAVNNNNETALFYAARQGHLSVIRLLLRNGADPNILDNDADKALDHCKNKECETIFNDCWASTDSSVSTSSLAPSLMALIYACLNKSNQIHWRGVSKVWLTMPFVVKAKALSRTGSGSNSSSNKLVGSNNNSGGGSGTGKRPPSVPYNRGTSDPDMSVIRTLAASPVVNGSAHNSSSSSGAVSSGEGPVSFASSAAVPVNTAVATPPVSVWRAMTPTGTASGIGGKWEGELAASLGWQQPTTSALLSRPAALLDGRKKSSSFSTGSGNLPVPPESESYE